MIKADKAETFIDGSIFELIFELNAIFIRMYEISPEMLAGTTAIWAEQILDSKVDEMDEDKLSKTINLTQAFIHLKKMRGTL